MGCIYWKEEKDKVGRRSWECQGGVGGFHQEKGLWYNAILAETWRKWGSELFWVLGKDSFGTRILKYKNYKGRVHLVCSRNIKELSVMAEKSMSDPERLEKRGSRVMVEGPDQITQDLLSPWSWLGFILSVRWEVIWRLESKIDTIS